MSTSTNSQNEVNASNNAATRATAMAWHAEMRLRPFTATTSASKGLEPKYLRKILLSFEAYLKGKI